MERGHHRGGLATGRRHGVDEAGLLIALRDLLDPYKVPKAVIVADTLPKTSTGKIQKNVVRATYADRYTGPGAG